MGFKVKACKACTLKCIRSHGSKAQLPTFNMSFFKIIMGESSKPLFLPPKFARTLVSSVDEDTYLEDSNGERWSIKLSTIDGSLAFQQGWHEFASDHSIKIGEMLIFKYIIGSHFVVQIFGKHGCEKLNFSKKKRCDRRKRIRTGLSAGHFTSLKDDRSANPTEVPCCRIFKEQFGQPLPTKLGSYKPGDDKSGPEDLDEVPMATGKISHDSGKRQTASAMNHNVPFRMVDKHSVSKQRGSRTAPIDLSDSENCGHECDVVDMDKIPMPTKKSSQNCNTSERTHTTSAVNLDNIPVTIEKALHDEKSSERPQTTSSMHYKAVPSRVLDKDSVSVPVTIEKAPCDEKSSEKPQTASSMDYKAVPSHVFNKGSVSVKGGSRTEKSSRIGNGSGRFHTVSSIDQSQHTEATLYMINKDAVDMGKVPMPTKKSSHNCNASDRIDMASTVHLDKVPVTLEKTPHHEKSSERLQTASSMDYKAVPSCVFDKDSISVKGGNRTEKSSQSGNGSGRFHTMSSIDHSQHTEETSYMINKKSVISERVGGTAPPDLSLFEMFERKYGAKKRLRTLKRCSYNESSSRRTHTRTNDEKNNLNISKGVRECMDNPVLLPKMEHSPHVEKAGSVEESIRKVLADAIAEKYEEKANPLLKVDEKILKVVKAETESMDSIGISSPDGANCSCSVAIDTTSWLVLPENFPISNKGWRTDRKVILLRDPAVRVWPVFYHVISSARILASGWEAFATANGLREGNVCVFEVVANESEHMFQVSILKE